MTLEKEDIKSLIENYIRKGEIAIENTEFLINNEKFSLAINQCYYGIFYMLSALALQNGFKTSKHEQLIGWFNKTYVKNDIVDKKIGKLIIKSYENRKKGIMMYFPNFPKKKPSSHLKK